MKKAFAIIISVMIFGMSFAQDTVKYQELNEVVVTSFYRNDINVGSLVSPQAILEDNHGQSPDYVLQKMPSIYAYNDNGTQTGYCYFRLRGMGQERMNVTLDGVPWNESEDFGCYFSNFPNLMGSMHSMKVERGASVTNNGTAAYAGNISLESVNLLRDTESYVNMLAGSFNTFYQSAVYNSGLRNKWAFHIAATNAQTDGYREGCYNNSQSFNTKIGYYFNRNHYIDFLGMVGNHHNGQGYMGVPMSDMPDVLDPWGHGPSGNKKTETDNFLTSFSRLQYHGNFNDNVFLVSTLYWNHQNGDYRCGWDDVLGPVLNNYNLTYNMYGANTSVKWYANSKFTMLGGFNANIYKRNHRGYDIPADTIIWHMRGHDAMTPYYDNNGTKPEMNLFATAKYSPTKKLKIDASLQYRYTALKYDVNVPCAWDPAVDVNKEMHWNFINYGANVYYEFNKHGKAYFRYAHTNREPSRTDMFGAEYFQGEMLAASDPESVNDFELGYDYASHKLSFNVNGFHMMFNDELVATGELSPINFLPLHTQHDGHRTGIEASVDYMPINNLHLIANASLSMNKINVDGTTMNHTFSPSHTLYAEANYKISRYKFGVSANYRSEVYMDIDNTHTLPELLCFNAFVNADVNDKVEIGINLNNLSNRMNFSAGSVDGMIAYYTVDSPFALFGHIKIKF